MELPRGNGTFSERRLNSTGYALDEPQFLNAYFHVHFFPRKRTICNSTGIFYHTAQRYSKVENRVNTARIVIYYVMCICIIVFCIDVNYNI